MPSLDFSQAWPWLQWIIAVAAVVAFIGGAIKVVPASWRVVSKFVTTINSLGGLPEFIDRTTDTLAAQDKKIAEIHHEVHFNNGSSVKDATNRIEVGVAGLYDQIKELKESDGDQSARLRDIEDHLPPRDEHGRFTKKDEDN